MTPHPEIKLRPLTAHERAALRESIERVGVIYPILTWGQFIVDGRHRWEISQELGLECPTRMLSCTEDEAIAVGLEANLNSGRQMNLEERARVAAALHALIAAGVNCEAALAGPKPRSGLSLAQSQLQLDYINAVKEEGCQELYEAVLDGVIHPRHAYNALEYGHDVQRAAVGAVIANQYQHLPEALKAIHKIAKGKLVDQYGYPIQKSMESVWLQRECLRSRTRQLGSTISYLRKLAKSPRHFFLFIHGDPISLGVRLHWLMKDGTPTSVCMYCRCHKGEEPKPDCKECGGYGLLGRRAARVAARVAR